METKNRIKAVFFDIDGTLVDPATGQVPQSTVDALGALRKQGIKIIVATGRHISEIGNMPISDIRFDGYLTLNGQILLDEERRMYAGTPIDRGEMEVLAKIFEAKKIPFVLIGENNRYINVINETVKHSQETDSWTLPDFGAYHGEDVYQILAFVPEHHKQLLDDLLDECAITSWSETGIDIIPRNGGKSTGIQKFLDSQGLRQDEIMAFGDGQNDIEMLRFAGIGIAMGNAKEEVKKVADYVTDTVDHDGIAKALRRFGLIK